MKIFQIPSQNQIVVAVETGKVLYRIAACSDAAAVNAAVAGVNKGIKFDRYVEAIKTRLPTLTRRIDADGSITYT